jgi:2-polyprenyl-6-methoxyphenol hydroxylase-like FAD-dependent oxidoreductase
MSEHKETIMNTHYPILVVGAGLGGLTLARVLHVHGIEAAVFDLETDRYARTQGGMLDIHTENGQVALRHAELTDGFRALVHQGGESQRVLDKHAKVHWEEADDGTGDRPEVDRGQLRDLLLDSLPEGTVHWGRRVAAATPLGGGRHEVTFADATTVTTDLLVGADGAWSRIRPLVSDAWPAYTGISFVEADLFDADARHPKETAVVGNGMLFALGDSKAILGHRTTSGSLHVYTAFQAPESWLDTIDFTDIEDSKKKVIAEFEDWDESLQALVANADGPLVPRKINALPIGHRWDRVPGVTLLGDAAHVMSPFAGEGANLAMLDGALLGEAIASHPGTAELALIAYEEALFPRSAEKAQESVDGIEVCFGENAVERLVEMFTAAPPDDSH